MFRWISQYHRATKQTKLFIINWAIYMILIIVSTVYVYSRLDFVRSGPHQSEKIKQTKNSL